MFTPIITVATATLAFYLDRDIRHAIISLALLLILAMSITLAIT